MGEDKTLFEEIEEVKAEQDTQVMTIENKEIAPVQNREDQLLAQVMQSGNIEVLERYLALREREETRQALLHFDEHFSEMQKEFVPAKKTKKAYDSYYAPIEDLQKFYGPTISKHGFSYAWREDPLENGIKRITIMISGWGYTKTNSFDVPILPGTKQMNPIQIEGARTTYGRRYTFLSGFGITTEDDDTDGNATYEDGVQYGDLISLIRNSKTVEELQANARQAWTALKEDKHGKDVLQVEFEYKKVALRGK